MPSGLEGHAALLAELAAWQELVPPSGSFTALTAARVHRLWLPRLPTDLPHFVGMGTVRDEVKPERAQLIVSRHPTTPRCTLVDGIRVARLADALVAAGRYLDVLDLTILIDSALHLGLCSMAELRAAGQVRRRGVVTFRAALDLAHPASESAWETMLRILHIACGVGVVPQAAITDQDGRFVARADLLVEGTRLLQEYDGAHHRDASQHADDLRRDRALAAAGHQRSGYVARDLLQAAYLVIEPVERALGRRIDLGPWLDLVARSTYSATGRKAFAARLPPPPFHPWNGGLRPVRTLN
ncbi:hypothetical protein GCM10009798_03940 [Nocardioides panacihumi]|uniref:DUF559 domain-containing protein n=2 Tax=Nocardioides panacihumi TaxID=400774 RepID=A0ABP5BL81_9ACTN